MYCSKRQPEGWAAFRIWLPPEYRWGYSGGSVHRHRAPGFLQPACARSSRRVPRPARRSSSAGRLSRERRAITISSGQRVRACATCTNLFRRTSKRATVGHGLPAALHSRVGHGRKLKNCSAAERQRVSSRSQSVQPIDSGSISSCRMFTDRDSKSQLMYCRRLARSARGRRVSC